ncbi:PGPGW domain-containing protein [Roseomonas sp. CCTCC AB2023176]|uniref:PGPGW domain-containing protein n=1 Tax=Roseomonas sp. CCTCC AB2023176 TaxID=3342640 RepID=UPI0035DDCC1C
MPDDARAAAAPPPTAAYVSLRPDRGRKILGWSFIVLGILGCILPFLQGFLFLALGVFVLRDQYVWAAERWGWVARKWPGVVGPVEGLEQRMADRFSRWGASLRRMIGRG